MATNKQGSIWSRPERGARGPSATHSREAIVDAAVGLADDSGLAAVSMRAVATTLGTAAGSLYRHLSSRDDLLDLMQDRVIGELHPYPEDDVDWLSAMVLIGRRQLDLYRRHRWLLDLTVRPTVPGPQALTYVDACLRTLEPTAAPVTARFEAIGLLTGVVTLVARSEAASGAFSFAGTDLSDYPSLASALSQPAGRAPDQDLFERTVRILLAGLLTRTETL